MVFVVGMEEHRRMLVRGGVRVAGVPGEARVMVEWRSSSYIATIPNLGCSPSSFPRFLWSCQLVLQLALR